MIISHQYRYVFVELPHTASTAISKELCENYGGQSILHKHTHYYEFLEQASDKEKEYLALASMRNPMDIIVTRFFKRKTNHQGFFTNPKYWRTNGGHVTKKALMEYKFIQKRKADFPTYFRHFYRLPYDSWGCPSPDDYDFVIRYENLQKDFSKFLDLLGISQIRPLPKINITEEKMADFHSYYSPEIQKQSIRFFSPYFELWDYQFPSQWGNSNPPIGSKAAFHFFRFIRKNIIQNTLND